MDIDSLYIKPHSIKGKDWYTGAYRMDQEDIEQIIKEWSEEWNASIENVNDSNDKETSKDKDRGKEKVREKKENERIGEKQKASKDDPKPHKRQNMRAHKPPTDTQLG